MSEKKTVSKKMPVEKGDLAEEMSPQEARKLKTATIIRFSFVVVFLMISFFGSAGTFHYWEAWVYLVILLVPMLLFSRYLFQHDLGLLKRRMEFREKEQAQKWIILVSSLLILPVFILPGIDQRYGWSNLHPAGAIAGQAIVLLGYYIITRVFIANSYAARTVQVEKEQRVIDTGPYAYVRHPMYTGTIMLYGFTPLALGSWIFNLYFPLLIVMLVFRILNEEKVLQRDLKGYTDYKKRVRWRLIPGIW